MFRNRSYEKELLDQPQIPTAALHRNLYELDIINSLLGGHAISIAGINKVMERNKATSLSILDIGCGGGDNLRAISKYFSKTKHSPTLTGADLKPDCISYARAHSKAFTNITYFVEDFRNVLQPPPDVVHAALFFHHFNELEIAEFLSLAHSRGAYIVINDLERNPIAYWAIKLLTALFSKSYLVKNDAPLSVKRGFKKKEWESILKQAGIHQYTITNRWAFRHLIITYPDGK